MALSLCEFCKDKFAVLHCSADSANLCLICDRHVHSANALSLKHTRWWICHNCGAKPASVSSSRNGLFLSCQGCTCNLEGQAHTTWSAVEEFSGCPSADCLASVLGLMNLVDLSSLESCLDEQKVAKILDGYSVKKELCEQLIEMGRTDLARAEVDGAELRPRTPPTRRGGQTTPFSSLLLLPMELGLKLEQSVSDVHVADEQEDLLWDYIPTYDSSLVCLKTEALCKFFTIMTFVLVLLRSSSYKYWEKLRSRWTQGNISNKQWLIVKKFGQKLRSTLLFLFYCIVTKL